MNESLYKGEKKSNLLYFLAVILTGLVTILKAVKLHPALALIIACFWAYMALKPFSGSSISINLENDTLIIIKRILFFNVSRKEHRLSSFYGVRNRVHWGFFMNCQTELLQRNGSHIPIRIEVFCNEISEGASTFKKQVSETFKLESRPDQANA